MLVVFLVMIKNFPTGKRSSGRGGRGSGFRKEARSGIGNASDDDIKLNPLLNAKANTQIDYKSYKSALRNFADQHSNANREYAYVMSDRGYVYQYQKGEAHRVGHEVPDVRKLGITKYTKNERLGVGYTIVHNHPSGSNFSRTDLESWLTTTSQKRVVAVGRKSRIAYTVTKTRKFNAEGFQKALDKAVFRKDTRNNYNNDVEKFLKKNAKNYGYFYSAKKV